MSNHYLAFTIGPIFQTITRARKTRELWASSYVFSLLMRRILEELPRENILLPHVPQGSIPASDNGAGIWPDRCIVQITKGTLPDVKAIIDKACEKLAGDLKISKNTIQKLVKISPLKTDWEKSDIANGAKSKDDRDLIPVHRLYRLLDNLELAAAYQPKESQTLNQILIDQIHDLYDVAGHKESNVFIPLSDGTVRLPSLPEIALREIKDHPEFGATYIATVEDEIDKKVVVLRRQEGRAKDLDGQRDNELLFAELRKKLQKDSIEFRHKYVAVVVADGDGMGETITRLSKEDQFGKKLTDFSKDLMRFSRNAVQDILDYGGLPVFAGGDDLLFLAPVTNANKDAKNILQLCQNLNLKFQKEMDKEGLSLSFGVSIAYYKHPLGEAVATAYELEKKAKNFRIFRTNGAPINPDKPASKKNALCFQVQKHSGQPFGATVWLGKNDPAGDQENPESSAEVLLELLDAAEEINDAFLTSVMHKLQSLPDLLAHATRKKNLDHFREHHFNEGGKHEKDYLKRVMDLAKAIFADYGDEIDPRLQEELEEDPLNKGRTSGWLDLNLTNTLFAALRLKQFLIQPDHE